MTKMLFLYAYVGVASHLAGPEIVSPVEALTNPFGGMPPEYSDGSCESVRQTVQTWTGTVLGFHRQIFRTTSWCVDGSVEDNIVMNSQSLASTIICYGEPHAYFSKNSFTLEPHIGGCWNHHGNTNDPMQFSNLGGYRYGKYDCQLRSKKKGRCAYTTVRDGKEYIFDIDITDYSEWP